MALDPAPLADIEAARDRLEGTALRTPLVPLNLPEGPSDVYLKLEGLQPVGSFKMRGLGNAVLLAAEAGAEAVWTVSAGNAALGLAWYARRAGLQATVVVPDAAPATKLRGIRRWGARIVQAPRETVMEVALTGEYEDVEGRFVHPFADPAVLAGNGTIGLELLEDLPAVAAVLVPYGGGGLSCGIASALRALRTGVTVLACEVETAAPLRPALEADAPAVIEAAPSFVDGIGAPRVFPQMWPLAKELLDGSRVLPLEAVARAIRLLVEHHGIVAEGASATTVAAALEEDLEGPTACIVSGRNLDPEKLAVILEGRVPPP